MCRLDTPMRYFISLCLFFILFVIFFLNTTPSFAAASAIVPATDYSFGDQWQGGIITHVFTVRNNGNEELRIEDQKITGAHTSARFKRSLAPGQEMEVILSVDIGKYSGDVDTGLVLRTNDPDRPRLEFHIRGHVSPILTFRPLGALFFSTYKGQSTEKSIEILDNYKERVAITSMESKSDRFSCRLETIKEGREYRFSAKVNAKASLGRTMEEVVFHTDNAKLPQFSVGVNIFVKDDVYTFPDDINFGTIDLDRLKKEPPLLDLLIQTILVKRKEGKGKDFQITLEHHIPFISIKKDPESGSETYRLDVSLIPEKMTRGKINSFIRVLTNDKEVPEIKIPVVGEIR